MNMEPKRITRIEKEKHLNQTSIFGVPAVSFSGA